MEEARMTRTRPSVDAWLEEIKQGQDAARIGMYLVHNGVVRGTTRTGEAVTGMDLSYDEAKLQEALTQARQMPGVAAVRIWINEGSLTIGDDIMLVLVAGDIRDNVFAALQQLVGTVKREVVKEKEFRPA